MSIIEADFIFYITINSFVSSEATNIFKKYLIIKKIVFFVCTINVLWSCWGNIYLVFNDKKKCKCEEYSCSNISTIKICFQICNK